MQSTLLCQYVSLFTLIMPLVISINANASKETGQKVTLIYAESYHELGKNDLAIQVLEKYLAVDEKNAELWGYLAQRYLDVGKPEKASEAFGKAALYASAENVAPYNYHRASATAQAKNVDHARNYLMLAANDPTVAQSAKSAVNQLVAGQPLPPLKRRQPAKWGVTGSIKYGHDDNVLLFSETALSTAKQTDTASNVTSPAVEVNYKRPVNAGLLNASLSLSAQMYDNEDATAYESIGLSQTTSLIREKVEWLGMTHSFSNIIKTSYLDSEDYEQQSWDDTVQWKGTKNLSQEKAISYSADIRYQDFKTASGADPDDDRTGVAIKPAINFQNSWRALGYSLGLSYEHLFADGKNFKSDTIAVPVSVQKQLPWSLQGTLGLTYSYVSYGESDSDRADGNLTANASLQRKLTQNLSGALEYSYVRNSSTEVSATYDRQTIEVKVIGEL